MAGKWKWVVTGFASDKHPHPKVKYGDLLVQTRHLSDSSKDVEVLVWQQRMAWGHVAYFTVYNSETGESSTTYPIGQRTRRARCH